MLEIEYEHMIINHPRGILMTYLDEVIPVVDCRARIVSTSYRGALAVIAKVHGKNLGIIADRFFEEIKFSHSERFISNEDEISHNSAVTGCVWRKEEQVFIIDLEQMFGCIVKKYF